MDFKQLLKQPEVRDMFSKRSGAHQELGIEVIDSDDNTARMRVPFRGAFIRSIEQPALHAGVVMTAVDSAMGLATMLALPEPSSLATLELRYDELRVPGECDDVVVSAQCESIDDVIAYLHATASDSAGVFARAVARFILTPSTSGFFETVLATINDREGSS